MPYRLLRFAHVCIFTFLAASCGDTDTDTDTGLTPISCEDAGCATEHRECQTTSDADATCGDCLEGYTEENGVCAEKTPSTPLAFCESNTAICGEGTCVDTDDHYTCECVDGFEFDGTTCVDADECEADSEVCGDNSTCTNTTGSYECACIEGFEFDDSATCVDIDECALLEDVCEDREVCTNTFGSYECACMEGLLPTEIGCQPRVLEIAGGGQFSCAIVEGGALYCWGSSNYGELGIGEKTVEHAPPSRVGENHTWRSIQAGQDYACGITSDNDLYCWGWNLYGALGAGYSGGEITEPERVLGGHKWLRVDASQAHTCGITSNHELYCWGWNERGQLGHEPPTAYPYSVPTPTQVGPGLHWLHVATGHNRSCGITDTDALYCWGHDPDRVLGTGEEPVDDNIPPSPVLGDRAWSAVDVGGTHVCGISEGELYCWGGGFLGVIGLGDNDDKDEPTRIGNETDWSHIDINMRSSCALRNEKVYCWGQFFPIWGGENFLYFSEPTALHSEYTWSQFASGSFHSCGISDGVAYCWGTNTEGQLGHNGAVGEFIPRPVEFLP